MARIRSGKPAVCRSRARCSRRLEFEVSREFGDADEPERDAFANIRFESRLRGAGRPVQDAVRSRRADRRRQPRLRHTARSRAAARAGPRPRRDGPRAPGRPPRRLPGGVLRPRRRQRPHVRRPAAGSDALAGRVVVVAVRVEPPSGAGRRCRWAARSSPAIWTIRSACADAPCSAKASSSIACSSTDVGCAAASRPSWALGPVSLVLGVHDRIGPARRHGRRPAKRCRASSRPAGTWPRTWVLTGERKDGRVDPEHSLFDDGLGALEFVARIEGCRSRGRRRRPPCPAPS